MKRLQKLALLCAFLYIPYMHSRDAILEFKTGYFLPTNSKFRSAYGGNVVFGPEFTLQLIKCKNLYAFASVEYFKSKGRFLSIADSIKLRLVPLALGLKYFFPLSKRVDLYLGLGFQATHIKQKSKRVFVTAKNTQWGLGALGKTGAYINFAHNFVFDLFFDYGFTRTRKNNFYGPTQRLAKVNLQRAIFGLGLGYRF